MSLSQLSFRCTESTPRALLCRFSCTHTPPSFGELLQCSFRRLSKPIKPVVCRDRTAPSRRASWPRLPRGAVSADGPVAHTAPVCQPMAAWKLHLNVFRPHRATARSPGDAHTTRVGEGPCTRNAFRRFHGTSRRTRLIGTLQTTIVATIQPMRATEFSIRDGARSKRGFVTSNSLTDGRLTFD